MEACVADDETGALERLGPLYSATDIVRRTGRSRHHTCELRKRPNLKMVPVLSGQRQKP